ncbi:MAG: alpha/beta hydrolase [Caulobacterales bacterium]
MRAKLNLITLAAACVLALSGCGQQSAPTASAPAPTDTASAPPVDEIPADLSATAPPGGSDATKFEGEAPPLPPPPSEIAAAPPPAYVPPVITPDPSGGAGPSADDYARQAELNRQREEAQIRQQEEYESAAKANAGAAQPAPPPPPPPPSGSGGDWDGGGGSVLGRTSPAPSVVAPKPLPPAAAPAAVPRSAVNTPGAASGSVMSKKADGTTVVKVYFATDRKIELKNNVRRFGGEEVNGLYYGTVDVSIPPIHEVGAVESPQWWKMEFTPDPDKHVVYQGFNLLKRDSFYTSLSALIGKSKQKEAFIFVHGFNTPFEDAARRTAQIEYDLKFDGAPIFYSWPSQGELSPLAYNKDATSSDRTVPRLKFFLKEVAQRTGAKRVHLVAHSMGNKAMVNALVRVASEMTADEKPLFNQIVLTAPDIDREVFMDLAQRIKKTGTQVTLYASKNDKALQASKTFNGFSRAGDAAPSPVVLPGIYTVDASAVTTDYFGLNHDFFASQRTVLGDLTKLIVTGATPDGRKLRKIKGADGNVYWVID